MMRPPCPPPGPKSGGTGEPPPTPKPMSSRRNLAGMEPTASLMFNFFITAIVCSDGSSTTTTSTCYSSDHYFDHSIDFNRSKTIIIRLSNRPKMPLFSMTVYRGTKRLCPDLISLRNHWGSIKTMVYLYYEIHGTCT